MNWTVVQGKEVHDRWVDCLFSDKTYFTEVDNLQLEIEEMNILESSNQLNIRITPGFLYQGSHWWREGNKVNMVDILIMIRELANKTIELIKNAQISNASIITINIHAFSMDGKKESRLKLYQKALDKFRKEIEGIENVVIELT